MKVERLHFLAPFPALTIWIVWKTYLFIHPSNHPSVHQSLNLYTTQKCSMYAVRCNIHVCVCCSLILVLEKN